MKTIITLMKTKIKSILLVLILISSGLKAQTIAVSNFSTHGSSKSPEIVAKMARLELIKLNKYTVMDEFDMAEVMSKNEDYQTCYGKTCLVELGNALNVQFMLSGAVDILPNKIIVNIKLIDVKADLVKLTHSMEFDNIEQELQRMIGIVLQEMHGVQVEQTTKSQLIFKQDVITSNNVGRINNTGPRVGFSYVGFGELNEFYTRKESMGGLEILPVMTNIGYQFEGQYIGTENFSALGELILNIGGMEQGQFIPTLSLLNGFRFGSAGWEIAFGPSIGFRKTSTGYFSAEDGRYYTRNEWENKTYNTWLTNPANFDESTGDVLVPYVAPDQSIYKKHLDKRGFGELSANWVMAFGKTFRSGALNIPVNIYYSSNKYGGVIGTSIGFNVSKRIKTINQ